MHISCSAPKRDFFLSTVALYTLRVSLARQFSFQFSLYKFDQDCTVVWWLAPSPHSKKVPGSTSGWGLSVWSLHVLPVYTWVLSGYSDFLPPSKDMHVRLIGDSKMSLGVSVSMCGCLSRLSLCGPVMDRRPVQGVPCLSPNDRWDRVQPPPRPD